MIADLDAPPVLLELTAGQLTAAHIGRVLQISRPPLTGLLLAVTQDVDSPGVAAAHGAYVEGASHLVLERPPEAGRGHPPFTVPVWVVPEARVVVDLTVEVGYCAACGQQLLRTPDDCWHPWHVPTACPPEAPLAKRPAGFRSGRPGAQHWRPIPREDTAP